jgi:hypothetical protein
VSGEIGSCSKSVEVRCAAVVDEICLLDWGSGGGGGLGTPEEGGAPRAFAIWLLDVFELVGVGVGRGNGERRCAGEREGEEKVREEREVEQRRQRQPELGRRFFPLDANFKHAGQRLSRWFILPKRA